MQLLFPLGLSCLLLSLLSYAAYASDKSAARHQRHRVPERALHLLAVLGGWPGALLAQHTLRHKTRKPAFQRVFWLSTLTHVVVVLALYARS